MIKPWVIYNDIHVSTKNVDMHITTINYVRIPIVGGWPEKTIEMVDFIRVPDSEKRKWLRHFLNHGYTDGD